MPDSIFHDPDLEARFDRDGYVVRELIDATAAERLRGLHEPAADIADLPFYSSAMSGDFEYRRRASESIEAAVSGRLRELLAGLEPVYGQFLSKYPSDGHSAVHIHQDWSFVDESNHRAVTVWCPLVDTDETSGCLAVVPGSHRLNRGPRGYVSRFPYPELESLLVEQYSVMLPLPAGRAVLFDQRLFHWSGPNFGETPRLAAQCLCASAGCRLLYPHVDQRHHPGEVELFEVERPFFTRFQVGVRPTTGRSLGWVAAPAEPLDAAALARTLGGARRDSARAEP